MGAWKWITGGLFAGWLVLFSCTQPKEADEALFYPNVLLITIDTLRADHLPAYGYGQGKTPAIDALAADGVLFENAAAHSPLTLPSHASILTGTYPLYHGVRNNGNYASASLTTMAEVFKRAGYDTAAFVGAFVLDSRFGLDQGFDLYDDDMVGGRKRFNPGDKERSAEEVMDRTLSWLAQQSKEGANPFFLWTHLYDPHDAYAPPEPYKTQYADHPYDGEIAYTDGQIGRLTAQLKALNRYDNTLIVLTSDHGESLGEHGEKTHSIFVYNATTWVPLILKLPGRKHQTKRLPELVRLIDLFPTMMDIALLKERHEKEIKKDHQGISLFPLIEGTSKDHHLIAYAESYLPKAYYNWSPPVSIRDDRYKFIDLPIPELYDLKNDPHELDNIFSENRKQGVRFSRQLDELKRRCGKGRVADSNRKNDRQTLQKLASLGYIGAAGNAAVVGTEDKLVKDPKEMIVVHEEATRIYNLIEKKRYGAAVEKIKPLFKIDPDNVMLRNYLAEAYKKLNRIDEAVREYRHLKKLNPKFVEAYLGLFDIYKRNNPRMAARELKAACAIRPKDPFFLVLEGDLLQEKGEIKSALEKYTRALEKGEQSEVLYVGIGSAFTKLNRLGKAEQFFLKAIDIKDDYSDAHYNLGIVYEKTGKPQQAEKHYRLAVNCDPQNHYAHTNLGSFLTGRKRYREAEKTLKAALAVQPDHLEAVYNLGTVYLNLERPAEAVPYLKKALAIKPDLLQGYNNLAIAFTKLGDTENTYKTYREMAQAAPKLPLPWYRMALVAANDSKMDTAKNYLDKAIELGGKKISAMAGKEALFKGLL